MGLQFFFLNFAKEGSGYSRYTKDSEGGQRAREAGRERARAAGRERAREAGRERERANEDGREK
jgi:hypothetical protein